MKTKFLNAALTCLVVLSSTVCVDAQISSVGKDRAVAVTFDDLPVISLRHDLASQSTVTRKLLHAIKSNRVPAIGFVNENKLLTNGTLDERRVGFLRMWLDAGLELGNHTFSHPDLHSTPLDIFKEDVVRGEEVTRGLLQAKGRTLRYFRHPLSSHWKKPGNKTAI